MRRGDGLSPFLWEYCLGLKERGWAITVLVPHHKNLPPEETWDDISIKRFKYLPERSENLAYSGGLLPGLKSSPQKAAKIPFYIYSMYSKTSELLSSGKFDIVNFHWLFPVCFWLRGLRRKQQIPIVLTGHGTDILLANKGVFRWFANRSLPMASAITVNSRYMKNKLKALELPETVEIIPMGVDIEKFSPGTESPAKSKKILFIGRLIEQKGVMILLEAFGQATREFPDAKLEIVGYGPQKRELLNKISYQGLTESVKLSDPVDYGLLPKKYRSARVLALPSLIPEGLGMTAVEAASCGVPTITFGLGGTSELVVDSDTGVVAEMGRKPLAAGLIRLLTDDSLVDKLGRRAREVVSERYAWPVITEQFDTLFRRLIKR